MILFYISIILLIVLFYCTYKNRYIYKKIKSTKNVIDTPDEENIDVPLEVKEEKKELDPESDVLLSQTINEEVQTIADSLNSDGVVVISEETTEDKLNRELLTANEDGKQPEGMAAPIDEFENNSLSRQGY